MPAPARTSSTSAARSGSSPMGTWPARRRRRAVGRRTGDRGDERRRLRRRGRPAGSEVWVDMLDRGAAMPGAVGTGEVLGVVDDAMSSRRDAHLVPPARGDRRAATTDEIVGAARGLRPTMVALHRARTAPLHVAGIQSVVVDALVRKLTELAVAELGTPPAPFAWLALGSLARREARPGSDVDSAVAWRGDDGDEAILEYALGVTRRVDGGLAGEIIVPFQAPHAVIAGVGIAEAAAHVAYGAGDSNGPPICHASQHARSGSALPGEAATADPRPSPS